MAKSTSTGRSKGTPHVRLDHSVFYSPAFRALDSTARALLFELIGMFRGNNNGGIFLSIRDAAKLIGAGSDATAMSAFKRLQAHRLIVATSVGSFSQKIRHATCWRLTFLPTNSAAATREYVEWRAAAGSGESRRLLSLSCCKLRRSFLELSGAISGAEAATEIVNRAGTVSEIGTAIVQRPQGCANANVSDFGAHLDRHLTPRRRASRDACIRARENANLWLNADPTRTQKELSRLTGITPSTLSRFLHDSGGRRTLKIDQLRMLEDAVDSRQRLKIA